MAGSGRKNADTALVAALASGATVEAAASLAGVSERTVYRRLEDPDFKKRATEARAEMIEQAVGKLAQLSAAAASTLGVLLGPATPPSTRLGAARAVLELGARLREGEDLEKRISELEAILATQGPERGRSRWAS